MRSARVTKHKGAVGVGREVAIWGGVVARMCASLFSSLKLGAGSNARAVFSGVSA